MYVSGLQDVAQTNEASLPSFANDFTLYCSRKTMDEAVNAASIATAPDHNVLSIILGRKQCRSMLIPGGPTNAGSKHAVYCNGLPITSVSQAILLGMIVQDLSWAAHIDALQLKIGGKIGVLRRTSRQFSCAARRMFLVSVVQPDLEYAAAVTTPSMCASEVNQLLKVAPSF